MTAQTGEKRGPGGEEVAKPRRLGRGLAALIGDMGQESEAPVRSGITTQRVPTAFLKPNPHNPRKSFAPEQIEDLANSIREKGIVQPIIVRAVDGAPDSYEIVAGERRWRAAQRAGLHEVPVLVYTLTDREALEVAVVENVQRADLNPIEEALGYQQLVAEFDYTQEALAKVIGKSRSHVANMMRLLKLPEGVQDHLKSGRLSAGHARALITHPDPEALARRIVEFGFSVRDAESAARKPKAAKRGGAPAKDADTLSLEKVLSDALGMKVVIDHRGGEGGEVKISYRSLEQLDDVCRRLKGTR
jgi:ParB family chromosome partitioning protein